jgi:hypothetical protein
VQKEIEMNKQLTLMLVFFMLIVSPIQASELAVGYDSRYVSEGRNQLTAGGIYWINGVHEVNENLAVSLGHGLAQNTDVDYDEFYLAIEYAYSLAGFDYSIGYTRFEFFKSNESDAEITLGLHYTQSDFFTPFSNIVYSVEADGFFVQIGAQKDIELNEKWSIASHVLLAFDFAYASPKEDGYNHTSVGASFTYASTQRFAIRGIFEQTFGGSIINNESNKANQFWSGIQFIYSW